MTNPPSCRRTDDDKLLCCAAGAAAFQEVIDCAAELLHACVIVADPLHYVLAVSSNLPMAHPTWSDLIDAGAVPPIYPKSEHSPENHPIPGTLIGGGLRLHDALITKNQAICTMGDIYSGQTLLLRFAVTSAVPLTDEQRHLVTTLAFTLQLSRHKWSFASHQDAASLYLLDLLHNRTTTNAGILQQIHFDTESTYRIYCFDTSDLSAHNLSFIPISALIQATPNTLSTMDGSIFILLVSCRQDYSELRRQLAQFAQEAHFPVLESVEIEDLYQVSAIYQIMQVGTSAARSFHGAEGIFQLSDFSMFLFFYRIIKYGGQEQIIHTDAVFLTEYDQKKRSDLAQTAYCYLLHNREAPATADALFIHRNTLDKRLRKIESLVNAQWRSVSYQLVMMTSLYQLLKEADRLVYYKLP